MTILINKSTLSIFFLKKSTLSNRFFSKSLVVRNSRFKMNN